MEWCDLCKKVLFFQFHSMVVLVRMLFFCVALYRKIVSYVLLRSGLGSPTELAVVREATGMLLSLAPL